ncbi:MAG: hypothetical protein ABI824_04960 [Acidobacteriota bacterium]
MNPSKLREHSYQSRTMKGNIRLICWNLAWVASCAVMSFGPRLYWNKASVLTPLAIGLNVAVGVGLILGVKNYIKGLDELQRKVYFNALAITGGVALIAGIPLEVMDRYDVIWFHAKISHLVMIMGVTFVVSIAYGNWRYR